MPTAVTMPQLGESLVEGTVTRWLKQPGETVEKLEPLLEIATDKIDTEVPSPVSGVLLGVLVTEGETVDAGSMLAYIGFAGEAMPGSETTLMDDNPPLVPRPSPAEVAEANDACRPTGRAFISPVVARIAAEQGVDLANVPGTGMNGRITKKDLLGYVEKSERRTARNENADTRSSIFDLGSAETDEVLQPLTTMRRAIAEHMVRSSQTSPHVTAVHEVDMTAVVRHREVSKEALAAKGVRLTFTPYFVMATVAGLLAIPRLNARFTEQGIVRLRRIHIGVAAAVEDGLVVPVIHDADERNLTGLARAVNELAAQAKMDELTADQLQGGTFTLTNHGVGGSLLATPIINQPQAAILGVGAIVKRPVVRCDTPSLLPSADDAIVIRPMCYLSLSFDHRLIDGAMADAFLRTVKKTLETWEER